ncbi:membrane dipeptidase [Cytophagaceae bacterium DM2B3-1]|uniref:Membrane dipeptidase n=1 Tax=Xanthocytophaga flava TaxID=3048013 RepID=A0ABT7CF51_9BACT|nr:membrane dipeptidase [Xanthocytophaga flavus]MDJ1472962.1 membrane dipeptidase [Xanthocytophaga flavus]MDJ1492359.1 membrane dipeptidase [Xanthocytophaga flavus]
MFTIDAHLDLSMNAMEWNRDIRQTVDTIRKRETGMTDKPDRAKATVSLPQLREGNVGLVVATQIARYVAPDNPLPGWSSPEQAWAQTQAQVAWYKAMEEEGQMVQIHNLETLEAHLNVWNGNESSEKKPIGYILSLEGADSLVTVQHVERAYTYGLRAIGPAHYGPGRYAQGTDATGGLGVNGRELLKEMERLNIILDATHLCDDSFWEAMDHFHGAVWASHNNCRALVNHNRQFSDEQIKELISRDAVIGGALDAWMMVPGWVRGKSTPESTNCNLEVMIDHLDHICQLAGNALHIGIGSDLDGAFGKEQCPYDLETIADLQKIPDLLSKRGYTDTDIQNVMHGNWLRFLRRVWSK